MAYATQIDHAVASNFPIARRLNGLVARIGDMRRRRKLYNATLNELHALSDRELGDLGLSRGQLRHVAHQAAYES